MLGEQGLRRLVLALKSHSGFRHHKSQRAANYWEKRTFKLQHPTWKWNNSLRGCLYFGKYIKTLTWSFFFWAERSSGAEEKGSFRWWKYGRRHGIGKGSY